MRRFSREKSYDFPPWHSMRVQQLFQCDQTSFPSVLPWYSTVIQPLCLSHILYTCVIVYLNSVVFGMCVRAYAQRELEEKITNLESATWNSRIRRNQTAIEMLTFYTFNDTENIRVRKSIIYLPFTIDEGSTRTAVEEINTERTKCEFDVFENLRHTNFGTMIKYRMYIRSAFPNTHIRIIQGTWKRIRPANRKAEVDAHKVP